MDNENDFIQIDGLKLKELATLASRRTWIFGITLIIIGLLFLAICGLIGSLTMFIFNNRATPVNLKPIGEIWHLYFISLFTLSTTLSIFAVLNKLTWHKREEEKKIDNENNILSSCESLVRSIRSTHTSDND